MRAYLIDATIRTIIEFDYIDELHEPAEILGGNGRGNFTLGSGPLAPPVLDDSADGFLADYVYVRDHGLEQWRDGDLPLKIVVRSQATPASGFRSMLAGRAQRRL